MVESNLASDLIRQNLFKFGMGMIKAAIPNAIDGLKPVHRRLLVVVKDKTGVIHSPRLVGDAAELHPHGESSIYNVAIRMGQCFEYTPPILDFKAESSGGTYAEPYPGAQRYTSCRVSEFTQDVFFKGIEYKVLPKELDELLITYEPIYFVPAIPTALLYANKSIGYGYSSYTIPHNLADVCDLVVAFAEHKKNNAFLPFDYVKHVQKFLPDFPVQGILTNPEELLDAYRAGNFNKKIHLDGEVRLTIDSINIKTLPYGVPFKDLEETIQLLMSDKNAKGSWFDKNLLSVKNLSNEHEVGDIVIKIKRGVNVFEAWEQLRKKIQFSSTITPIPNYNEDGYPVEISQPNVLAMWYNVRYNILISSKKIKITSLSENIRKVEALLIICDYVDEVIAILKKDRPSGIIAIMERFNLTEFQANYLSAAPLYTISSSSAIELKERKKSLEDQLLEVRASFSKIPDEIAKEALSIKKKYATPRKTRIPNYLGYVKIGGGCIQFESIEEITKIIEDFPKIEMEIHTYDGPHLYKVSDHNKLERGTIPKITTGDIYGLKSNQVITVNISDGTACSVKGFVPGSRADGYFYTTPKSRAIYRNGDIKIIDVTEEISLRKTICRGANTNIIYIYPDIKQDHYVIALNTTTPNIVSIQKVATNRSKIGINPTGNVLLFHTSEKHFFLNIPETYRSRNTTRVLELIDLEKVLEGKDQIRLDIGSTKVKTNKHIRLL